MPFDATALAARGSVCGVPGALSENAMLPLVEPAAVGEYCTVKEIPWPAAIVCGTVRPATVKPVPVRESLFSCRFALPVLVRVTVCVLDWPTVTLLNVTVVGEIESTGCVAFPCRCTLKLEVVDACAVIKDDVPAAALETLEASLTMVTSAERLPADWGANINCTVALCPAASVPVKFPPATLNPAPETLTLEMETAAVPVSVSVSDCVALLPTATFPKSTVLALAARIPVPLCVAVAAALVV